jgi:hypothetical protein
MNPTHYTDSTHPVIIDTARYVTAGANDTREQAVRINDFVRDHCVSVGHRRSMTCWRRHWHAPRVFSGVVRRKGRHSNSDKPPILTEGLRWRASSQFDAYHHVLWTTATSVGQAGASPYTCARGW